jgi:hypothetical protein
MGRSKWSIHVRRSTISNGSLQPGKGKECFGAHLVERLLHLLVPRFLRQSSLVRYTVGHIVSRRGHFHGCMRINTYKTPQFEMIYLSLAGTSGSTGKGQVSGLAPLGLCFLCDLLPLALSDSLESRVNPSGQSATIISEFQN